MSKAAEAARVARENLARSPEIQRRVADARTHAERAARADDWTSAITRFGSALYDKRMTHSFEVEQVSVGQAEMLWQGDDLAARMVERWPDDMLREGFDFTAEDGDKAAAQDIETAWEDLGLADHLWSGVAYGRGLGGGAIVVGADDGRSLDRPLNVDAVRSVSWLLSVDPEEATPIWWYSDPTAPKFGEPEFYQVNVASPGSSRDGKGASSYFLVHESRVVPFMGTRVRRRRQTSVTGWGDSIFVRVLRVLRDFNIAHAASAILASDFAQAVFKMKGLAEVVAADGDSDEGFLARARILEYSRSTARAVVIDAEEDFERKATPMTGLPELLERQFVRLAAAADMPLTVLAGTSPAGLNATGESDVRLWYDRVRSAQPRKLTPGINRVTTVIMAAMGYAPESWEVKYRSLWQTSAAEESARRLTVAQTDAVYISAGVVTAEEVAESRWGGDGYSDEMHVDFEAREEMEAMLAEADPADQPSSPAPGSEGDIVEDPNEENADPSEVDPEDPSEPPA